MYNYQTFLKEHKLKRKCDLIRKQHYEDLQSKKINNPSLIHSHKKRIEGFILTMVEKPNKVDVYNDKHYATRSTEKPSSIHEKSFHLNHLTQQERIMNQTAKNSVFDSVPFNNTFSHRFRDFKGESELKPMRYQSINGSLRVKERLESSTLNCLPNLNNQKINRIVKNPHVSWRDKSVNIQLQKSLAPSIHKKTYFQSLKTIFSESPNGFLNPNTANEKHDNDNQIGKQEEYEQETDIDIATKKEKKNKGQNMNRKQNCKEALIKCGLMGGKSNIYQIGMEQSSKRMFPNSHQVVR